MAVSADAVPPDSEIHTLKMQPAGKMTRAELKWLTVPEKSTGMLVLCPGRDGDGGTMFSKSWRDLARKNSLILVGLSFASDESKLHLKYREGYFFPETGAGKLLTDGLRKIAGKDLPVSIFGFSDGGQFALRWTYQNPQRVRAWCAYGFRGYDEPPKGVSLPPGIYACGLDDTNLPVTRDAFLSALRAKSPACWLGVPKTGHVVTPKLVNFVCGYFDAELKRPKNTPDIWKDADDRGLEGFLVRSRFPDETTAETWRKF